MGSVHSSKHQLWCKSFEGIKGAEINAAIAVTRLDVGCMCAWLCERLQASRSWEQSSSNHTA